MKTFEDILYYINSILIINIIILFKMLSVNSNLMFIIPIVLLIFVGVITTFRIYIVDDSEKDQNTTGKIIEVCKLKNVGDMVLQYFNLYIIIALTSPYIQNINDMIVYAIVMVGLGIVYIQNNLTHINPTLFLLNYRLYSYKDESANELLILCKQNLKNKEIIKYQNVNKEVIRIN